MRILFFINVLSAGGKERRLTELMKVLKLRTDCEFELAVMNEEIHYKEVLDLNIPIHYLIRGIKKDLSVFRVFFRLCKNYRPDIVHCWDSMTAIYSAPICKLLNIKLVNGLITNAPEKQKIFTKYLFRAKITFPLSDIIVANSKAGLRAYNAPKMKSLFIHNGFNFERTSNIIEQNIVRSQLKINTSYLIGMVANYSSYKDYETYFSAAQMLLTKRKDLTFIAIGENTNSALSLRHIKHENIEYFRLLGKISEVESYVNAMDICVLSTFTEGISNSILEYMALGKPVIATSGGGTNEIIIDNETGFLISRSSPEEIVEKIEMLLNSKDLLFKMGAAGQERIRNFFNIENMVNSYVALYKKVLTKPITRRMFVGEKILREILAFVLIQFYYIKKHHSNGITSIYFHNPSKVLFEKILRWLQANEYKFISIKELDRIINQKINNKNLVFISFDDGWNGNLKLIESIEKFKVPVTFFITTSAVTEGNFWWEYPLVKGQDKYSGVYGLDEFKRLPENTFNEKIAALKQVYYLERSGITLDDLKRISKNQLITIGSHTVTHPIMTRSSYETQSRELIDSKRILRQWLNADVEYLSYPNGNYNDDTIEIAETCGYKLCFTTIPGEIDVDKVNQYTIPRNSLYDSGGYFENVSKILGVWQRSPFGNKSSWSDV